MTERVQSRWEKLCECDTIFSADSVEWCPFQPDLFLCGTYQVQTETCLERLGTILVFKFQNELSNIQSINCPAVLDIKWSPHKINEKIISGVVDASGTLTVYELYETLEALTSISLRPPDCQGDFLLLSLDWSSNTNGLICASDSKGGLHVIQLQNNGLTLLYSWKGHDLEAWIVAFDANNNFIYSGSDDCKFKVWNIESEPIAPKATIKTHTSGVTTFHSCKTKEHVLASGSYDETVLIWDTRALKQPTHTINVDGGVWRLKYDPFNADYLLAACIYGGFYIINCSDYKVIADYKEHESLAYGADWSWQKYNQHFLIATCSFYDHKLTLSTWDNEINL